MYIYALSLVVARLIRPLQRSAANFSELVQILMFSGRRLNTLEQQGPKLQPAGRQQVLAF